MGQKLQELILQAEEEAIAELKHQGLLTEHQIELLRKKGVITEHASMAQKEAQIP